MKNPLTPAGIEPATFRFVAQHLNHCATAVPDDGTVVPQYVTRNLKSTQSRTLSLPTAQSRSEGQVLKLLFVKYRSYTCSWLTMYKICELTLSKHNSKTFPTVYQLAYR